MAEKHDSAYRLLFSHRRMVKDLLRGYVDEDWVAQADFDTLERDSEQRLSEGLECRVNDMVWKLRLEGGWVYVYLLLEFQSTVDRFMALRMLSYVSLFCEELARRGQLTEQGKLPPIVPLVVYNGNRPWTASREVAELFEPMASDLGGYQPRLRYVLIDEIREPAAPGDNLVEALFALERSRGAEEIGRQTGRIVRLLATEPRQLSRAFLALLKDSLLPVAVPEINELEEVQPMLRETVIGWTEEWLRQGRQEGRQQGRTVGQAELLIHQLENRFGNLAGDLRQRVEQAPSNKLMRWATRLLDATSLDQVFAD